MCQLQCSWLHTSTFVHIMYVLVMAYYDMLMSHIQEGGRRACCLFILSYSWVTLLHLWKHWQYQAFRIIHLKIGLLHIFGVVHSSKWCMFTICLWNSELIAVCYRLLSNWILTNTDHHIYHLYKSYTVGYTSLLAFLDFITLISILMRSGPNHRRYH